MAAVTVSIPYGQQVQSCCIPEANFTGSLRPEPFGHSEPFKIINEAFNHPVGSTSFAEFVKGKSILVIVNDASRATPTKDILSIIQKTIPLRNLKYLVATGSHQSQKEDDLDFIFGKHLKDVRHQIHWHQSKKTSQLFFLGTTRFGNSIQLNRLIQEVEGVIVIGSVEPHYFAGFTGGRKSFLPGIAGFDSITHNHQLALKSDAHPLVLNGNPVHEEMDEVLDLLNLPVFSIQTVLDLNDTLFYAVTGDIRKTFAKAVEVSQSIFSVSVHEPVDILIASVTPPLDGSLYQAHKAIENTRQVLKENGILILVAPCQEGVGDNPGFFEILKNAETPAAAYRFVQNGYKLGYHKVARLAKLMEKAQLWAVSELSHQDLNGIFFSAFDSLQMAVDKALVKKPEGKVLIVEAAGMTVPVLPT